MSPRIVLLKDMLGAECDCLIIVYISWNLECKLVAALITVNGSSQSRDDSSGTAATVSRNCGSRKHIVRHRTREMTEHPWGLDYGVMDCKMPQSNILITSHSDQSATASPIG